MDILYFVIDLLVTSLIAIVVIHLTISFFSLDKAYAHVVKRYFSGNDNASFVLVFTVVLIIVTVLEKTLPKEHGFIASLFAKPILPMVLYIPMILSVRYKKTLK